jgi:hypothetical protein
VEVPVYKYAGANPKGDREKSRRSARYAGKAMDGVKRKIRASPGRRSIIAWIDRNEIESRLQLAREGDSPEKWP